MRQAIHSFRRNRLTVAVAFVVVVATVVTEIR